MKKIFIVLCMIGFVTVAFAVDANSVSTRSTVKPDITITVMSAGNFCEDGEQPIGGDYFPGGGDSDIQITLPERPSPNTPITIGGGGLMPDPKKIYDGYDPDFNHE